MESALKADLTALRDRYRSSRDAQRTHTRVELIRPVSSDLTEALSLVPVTQTLSPWKPNAAVPLAATDLLTSDPWHEHLCLHRRSGPENQVPPSFSDSEEKPLSPPQSPDQTRPDPVPVKTCATPRPDKNQNQDQNQNQDPFPFPNRRAPRISETARRLGLYSSF